MGTLQPYPLRVFARGCQQPEGGAGSGSHTIVRLDAFSGDAQNLVSARSRGFGRDDAGFRGFAEVVREGVHPWSHLGCPSLGMEAAVSLVWTWRLGSVGVRPKGEPQN